MYRSVVLMPWRSSNRRYDAAVLSIRINLCSPGPYREDSLWTRGNRCGRPLSRDGVKALLRKAVQAEEIALGNRCRLADIRAYQSFLNPEWIQTWYTLQ